MASDQQDEERGLLPPDGVAWPPDPLPQPESLSPLELPVPSLDHRRDPGIDDWREMAVTAPDGYRGTTSAPRPNRDRFDPWASAAIVLALVGSVPLTWRVPVAPPLAIALGLTGRRNCSLDPGRRGARWATIAVVVGAATLAVIGLALVTGRLALGP